MNIVYCEQRNAAHLCKGSMRMCREWEVVHAPILRYPGWKLNRAVVEIDCNDSLKWRMDNLQEGNDNSNESFELGTNLACLILMSEMSDIS